MEKLNRVSDDLEGEAAQSEHRLEFLHKRAQWAVLVSDVMIKDITYMHLCHLYAGGYA